MQVRTCTCSSEKELAVTGYFRHSLKEKYQKNLCLEISMSLTNPLEKGSRTVSLGSFALSLSLCIQFSIHNWKKVLNTCASQGKYVRSGNENPGLFWDVTTFNWHVCCSPLLWLLQVWLFHLSVLLEVFWGVNHYLCGKIKNWAMNYMLGTGNLSIRKEKIENHVIHSCNQPVTINIWNFPSVSREEVFLNSATKSDIVAFLEAV